MLNLQVIGSVVVGMGSNLEKSDVVVIGGGPAGYVAAIRASQLGAQVILVEEEKLGGVCLRRGCIPTKFLLHSIEVYESARTAEQFGISVGKPSFALSEMQARKNKVISTLASGIRSLLGRNNIKVIKGRAKLTPLKQVEIDSGRGVKQVIEAKTVILATGSKPMILPVPGADSPGVIDTDSMLEMDYLPKSLLIVGGGASGVEMATIWAKLGSKVIIVEMMPHILPTQDAELTSILEGVLKGDGIQIHCGARVNKIEDINGGKLITFSTSDGEKKMEAEVVAVVVGQKPNVEGLGLDECDVATNKGSIQINDNMQTSVPNIYAAGDVVGGMMLAYVGMAEGKVAAENALGRNSTIDYRAVPQCIFSSPPVASVGLTEKEAIAQGYQIRIGRFPFAANGMATILGERRGLVKIIAEQKCGQILGVHIIGPHAPCLISEAAIAMKLESTYEDIIKTMHAHPTLSEALWEAALGVTGETIHFYSR